jgi:cytochrome c-type biogenesis protein CcmH/NrfG
VSRDRQELEERRDLALRDLLEVDEQVQRGELSESRAHRLRAGYEAEAAAALRALDRLSEEPTGSPEPHRARRRARTGGPIALTVATLATAAVAVVLLPGASGERPEGGFVSGNEVGAGRDLADVTDEEMEAVVAENPDVVPMRLRLARRYLDQRDWRRAFDHYSAVLDREPNPEAMSHLGWVVFNQGEPDLAEQLLEASLAREPDDAEALWFLANVKLLGTQDLAGAETLLDRLAVRDDLSEEDREAVEDARRAVRELTESTEGSR